MLPSTPKQKGEAQEREEKKEEDTYFLQNIRECDVSQCSRFVRASKGVGSLRLKRQTLALSGGQRDLSDERTGVQQKRVQTGAQTNRRQHSQTDPPTHVPQKRAGLQNQLRTYTQTH